MFVAIDQLLSAAEAEAMRQSAERLDFADGGETAGSIARQVKANDQARPSAALDAIRSKAEAALRSNPIFTSAARPRAVSPMLVSRYRAGQSYGLHTDDALMGGLRSDLSFTLFLSPPESYEGGALIVADALEERAFKLPAGALLLYPSTTLHRVEPVSAGMRLCLVGWVQSWLRDPGQREILFDLDGAIAELQAMRAAQSLVGRLARTRSNLLRLWAG